MTNILTTNLAQRAKEATLEFPTTINGLSLAKILPSKIVEIIEAYSTAYSMPKPFVLFGLLAATSAAIGKSVVIKFKEQQYTYCNIYLILVGAPNSNKTMPLRMMLYPIEEQDKHLYIKYKAELSKYKEVSDITVNKTEPPKKLQIVVKDSTIEALTDTLNENPRGCIIYCDEIAGLFRNMNKYNSGSDLEAYLEIWSGGSLKVNRKSSEMVRISAPFLSIVGTIQPAILKNIFKNDSRENGAMDRFDVCIPEGLEPVKWTENEICPTIKESYDSIIESLLAITMINGKAREIPFSNDAKASVLEWRNGTHLQSLKELGGSNLASAWGKMDIKLLKYCLIIEMLLFACGESDGKEITVRTVNYAIALTNYLKGEIEKLHKIVFEQNLTVILPEIQLKVYRLLGCEFKTAEGIKVAEKIGMHERTFKRFISNQSLFRRVERGVYKKLIDDTEA